MTGAISMEPSSIPPKPSSSLTYTDINDPSAPKKLPKGVVLGKDGKPCRSCTSFASWASMTKKAPTRTASASTASAIAAASTAISPLQPLPDCPPDVDALGTSTWTLLHTLTASYPPTATTQHQSQMSQFLSLFSQLYPCWVCADDFRAWMKTKGNEPRLESRDAFGRWMCEAHNEVNRKLGKEIFECGKWEERWRTGWKDGRCD